MTLGLVHNELHGLGEAERAAGPTINAIEKFVHRRRA
jgi:hypothetical protein